MTYQTLPGVGLSFSTHFLCRLYPFSLFSQTFPHPVIAGLLAIQPLLLASFSFGETKPSRLRSHLGLPKQISKNSVHPPL